MPRFIYIDTKGKEVPIPTVDALALRIELGAIKEDTRLYDGAGDRWAPAGEHEVFRSIVREQQERTAGFVAPPPPAPAAGAPPGPPPATAGRAPNPFEALEGPAAAADPGWPAGTSDPLTGLSFDLTLAPPGEPAGAGPLEADPAPVPPPEATTEAAFDCGGFGVTLSPWSVGRLGGEL